MDSLDGLGSAATGETESVLGICSSISANPFLASAGVTMLEECSLKLVRRWFDLGCGKLVGRSLKPDLPCCCKALRIERRIGLQEHG